MKMSRNSLIPFATSIALSVPLSSAGQTVTANSPTMPNATVDASAFESISTANRLQGRLFFSPAQRERMDDERKRGLVPGDNGQITEPAGSVVNGFVKRSDGNTAVWVDGVPLWNTKSRSADNLVPSDVGGPAAYLKATSDVSVAPARKPATHSKKALKPRARKSTKPRLLP